MKYKLGSLFILISVVISSCSSNKIISHPVKQGIIVDGNYDDWAGVKPFFVKDPPFILGMANSSDYLYLVLRSNDVTFMRQLRMFGFTLWLNKNKSLGLELPERFRWKDRREYPAQDIEARKLNGPKISLTVSDFFLKTAGKEEQTPLPNLPGFAVASGYRDGVSTVEFQIPIIRTGMSGFGVHPLKGRFKIGLQLKVHSNNRMSPMRGKGRSGMGGRHGGMGRTGNDGYRPQKQRMVTEKKLWFNIFLGNKQSDTKD